MTECDQEIETNAIPQKCRPALPQLRDFADRLQHHGTWCTKHKIPFEKNERDLRKAMEKAAAKLALAKQAHKEAVESWRMAQHELDDVLQGLWMEQMESDIGDALARFANSIGDVRKMAAVCQDFINIFADSVRWHVLYATCEEKGRMSSYLYKMFSFFRRRLDTAWGLLSEFTVSDKVSAARTALNTLLACWTHDFGAHGKDRKFLSLNYMKQWREEFARALIAVNEDLKNPETFFVRLEKEATHTGMETKNTSPHVSMLKELKQRFDEKFDDVKRYIARRTRTRKKGTAPGPKMSPTHWSDLKRAYDYVKQGFSVNKACEIVNAENEGRPNREEHYASAGSMRGDYVMWVEELRQEG